MSQRMTDQIQVVGNKWRGLRVEFMAYVGILAAVGSVCWAAQLLVTFGLNPGDGGVLRPFEERLLVATITAGCGIAFAISLLVYQSLFVIGISLAGENFYVHSKIACFNFTKSFHLTDVAGSAYRNKSGYWLGDRYIPPQYDLRMRIKGRWLPYVIDPQAPFIDRAQLARIIPKAVSAWDSDPYALT